MRKQSSLMKRMTKLIHSPGIFFRDYFNKKYPVIRNEILCPEVEESILIRHDLQLENILHADFPIDVVFTWVNDKDPKWQEKYKRFKTVNVDSHGQYATDEARFSNHNELYFSVKSVLTYLSWVNNIYIVTDEQYPEWVGKYDNVIVVDHKDIIPEKYLPTFNSHVIEAHLHKIDSLSEHFIYFNDDVFVARELPKGHFFKSNGIASIFLSRKNIVEMKNRGVTTPTLSASIHASELLKCTFGYEVLTPLVHTYVPLKKSMFEEVWRGYYNEIDGFLCNRFRTDFDLNLATFLVPWFSYFKQQSIPARDICYYFNIRSPVARGCYLALLKYKIISAPHSFCANDFTSTRKNVENYQDSLINMLIKYFRKGNMDVK